MKISYTVRLTDLIRHLAHRPSGSPFLEEVRSAIRVRHYRLRTEAARLGWIRRFIRLHGRGHPGEMGVNRFRTGAHREVS